MSAIWKYWLHSQPLAVSNLWVLRFDFGCMCLPCLSMTNHSIYIYLSCYNTAGNTKRCNCFSLITPSKEVRNIDGRKEALNQAESLKVKPQAFPNKPIDSRWLAVIESHVDRECAASFLSPWATRNKLIEEWLEENVLNRVDLICAKWKRWHKIFWFSPDKRNCSRCIVSTIVLYERRGQSPGRGTSRLKRVDVNARFPSKHHPPLHLRTPLSVYTICIHWKLSKCMNFL